MEPIGILYATPTWVTFVVTALIGLLAMEGGLRLGRRRADPEPEQGPVDTMTGGTVGLLAFLLAFAFGIAFVWWSLYLLAVAALMSLGYQLGLARSRRPVVALFGVLALAVVVTMIMDLDRGQQGFLTVSQRALEDVLAGMSVDKP
jgi:hypothetical protein